MMFLRKRRKNGDVIVIVKFEDGDGFNPDDQTWCPTAEQVEELVMELRFANQYNVWRRVYPEFGGHEIIQRQPIFRLFKFEIP